jgi:hypothetical protein
MPSPRARVRCVGVLAHAVTPFAVVVAAFRGGPAYVYLDLDERSALSDLYRDGHVIPPGEAAHERGATWPPTVRGHAIDAETGATDDGGVQARPGHWGAGEGLWVRTDLAEGALYALRLWRANHAPQKDAIGAPNWRALTAVRALALAAGLADPGTQHTQAAPLDPHRAVG